ncbi:phosphate propanoyltransferase [Neobacillus fumarioli]|uniref:phosphate propanoyltransferase n=1 Tax=Neobacillus fumarioli TaxID=105229 RepID=UPI000829B578|nr:phosphate propanoyltransferase [Neobacillus fumarioli]
MNSHVIHSIVEKVMKELEKTAETPSIPIGISARHVHVSQEHLEKLFGANYQLTKRSDLSQPGQFAANETVTVVGPKGSLERVRILGPVRGSTQIEVSKTDAIKLGLNPPLRESGNIKGSAPATIVGPEGSVYLSEGLIIAQNHIHMAPHDAQNFKVENGQYVQVKVQGKRPLLFDQVLIRVSPRYQLEMHIDTDEANAALCATGDKGILIPREKA